MRIRRMTLTGIKPSSWIKHFSKLFNSPKNRNPDLDQSAFASFEPVLDCMISKDEMEENPACYEHF